MMDETETDCNWTRVGFLISPNIDMKFFLPFSALCFPYNFLWNFLFLVWSSYDRMWFSGPDKQEIFIFSFS
jgi:hypothetical protein